MVRVKRPVNSSNESELDMFLRLWDQQTLTPTVARHLLKVKFSQADQDRMHELAVRNQSGEISRKELRELDSYVRTGLALSIIHSRARQRLKAANADSSRE